MNHYDFRFSRQNICAVIGYHSAVKSVKLLDSILVVANMCYFMYKFLKEI